MLTAIKHVQRQCRNINQVRWKIIPSFSCLYFRLNNPAKIIKIPRCMQFQLKCRRMGIILRDTVYIKQTRPNAQGRSRTKTTFWPRHDRLHGLVRPISNAAQCLGIQAYFTVGQGCRLGLLMSVTSSKIVFTLRLRNELYRYSRTGTNFTHIGLEIVGAFQRHTTAVFCITGDVKLKFATKHHRSFQHAFPPCLSPLLLFHQWRNQKFLVEGVEVRHRQPYRDVEGLRCGRGEEVPIPTVDGFGRYHAPTRIFLIFRFKWLILVKFVGLIDLLVSDKSV